MKRRLLLLNVGLLALIAVAGWQLRSQWVSARAKEQSVLQQRIEPQTPPAAEPPKAAEPLTAAAYEQVAQNMLFSRDRNPTVVVDLAPPKPMPSLPILHGVMDLGAGPLAIFSEKASESHRGYAPGEKVGEFKLVSIEPQMIVLEWEGETLRKRPEELRSRSEARPSQDAGPATPRSTTAPAVKPAARPQQQASQDLSAAGLAGAKSCDPDDTSPPGTVRDGMRKVVTESPFGKYCRWEPLR